ncbi:MAG: MMPL family transporter [Peptococcaceae bacterium]|nr:MMPL family transporter [Peptococcaceae bacterium]
MKKEKPTTSIMEKIAEFIIDKRNLFFLLYIAAMIFSAFSSGWVEVCNDLTEYLPDTTETRQGLTIMEEEFVTYATAKVMVMNISYQEAEIISEELEALPSVSMVEFDDSTDHYTNTCALFSVTLVQEEDDALLDESYGEIENLLQDYDTYITRSKTDNSQQLASEMNVVLAVAAVIIVGVLLFTSRTYMEIPVMLLTFVAAAILNKGTNFIFGEISFVSNSVTAVLQLALSIDYAIIMIHRYSEERKTHDIHDAVVVALSKAIPEISASSLTTISGLAALMFMQFQIGFDMGMVLIKSILFSLLSVFTLMPCLLMIFGKYIDKTPHKSFVPRISLLGKIVVKLKNIVPVIFVVVILIAYHFSSLCPFVYGEHSLKTDKRNDVQIASDRIEENFGTTNVAALLVPKGDYEKEKALIGELLSYQEIKDITALANIEAKDDYMLTDKLNPRQFSELCDIDVELAKLLYTLYTTENEDYAKLIRGIDEYGIPLIDIFMYVYDLKEDGYLDLDDDLAADLDDMHIKLEDARLQLSGENYTRILLHLDMPEEGEETFRFIDRVHTIAGKYYDTVYVVGNSTSDYDLSASFDRDNTIISILSVLFVIIVLFFTFKSAGLPILLIAVIQGSVWINFSFPYLTNAPLFFLSYLIVSSIQMGANIDYAIVISNRYLELKKELPLKEAITEALNFAFPTVLTSGSILAAAGFLISKLSTDPSIVSIGANLGRGTIISMFLVMCVLPEILLLGDILIERTSFDLKRPDAIKNDTGIFVVNGRVRGYINGFVDADIHGIVKGNVKGQIHIDTNTKLQPDNGSDTVPLAPEQISEQYPATQENEQKGAITDDNKNNNQ